MRNILFIIMVVGLLVVAGCSNSVTDEVDSDDPIDIEDLTVEKTIVDDVISNEEPDFIELGEMI